VSGRDVLTFGETMLAVRVQGPLGRGARAVTSVAGAESNVAVGLARLGHRVAWAGRVGADEPGRTVLRALRGEGVDLAHATTDAAAPTGALLREDRLPDLTRVHYWRSGSAGSRLTPAQLRPALDAGAAVLHLTGITCALGDGPLACVRAAAEHAGAHGWTVCLDVNHRSRLWDADRAARTLRPLLPSVDVLVASEDELPLVAGDEGDPEPARVDALLAAGVREVVVKRGARGARVRTRSGEDHDVAAVEVRVRDAVGAGDAFCAGYLSGLLDGLDTAGRLRRAVVLGAFAAATDGDWEGLPHRDELPLLDAAPGHAIR
jgi:2-dehydro-3-deoxygluconokinase